MSDDTLKELIQVAHVLESYKQQLVITIENPLDALPGPTERRAMVRQLYNLKDRSSIKLAYNNYTLDTKQADLLIELKLYDYIKMPISGCAPETESEYTLGFFRPALRPHVRADKRQPSLIHCRQS